MNVRLEEQADVRGEFPPRWPLFGPLEQGVHLSKMNPGAACSAYGTQTVIEMPCSPFLACIVHVQGFRMGL